MSEVYGPRIQAGDYKGVFNRLKQDYPKLYAKLVSLVAEHYAGADARNEAAERFGKNSAQYAEEVERWQKSDEEINLRDYFFSKAFDAMAIIGPEIDLEASLSELCED